MIRTHNCGAIRPEDIGKRVKLAGWVRFSRDHGGIKFIDLADSYGVTQIVLDPEAMPSDVDVKKLSMEIDSLSRESVIAVTGIVRERVRGTEDPRNPTGMVEILIEELTVLNRSKSIPFEIADQKKSFLPNEDLRLKFRYLDLRRAEMIGNLRFRHRVVSAARQFFDSEGFIEVETPILTRSTPEGARDFIVPSRTMPGRFYALPQSPQLYKQMLMIGSVDKYYQIARCFRDEDSRADRQPEFTQIDLEMSFVEEKDVQDVVERLLAHIWKSIYGLQLEIPFPRVKYKDAIEKFGTDAPDIRFGLEISDVTEIVSGSSYDVFNKIIRKGGIVLGINVRSSLVSSSPAETTQIGRKEVDRLIEWAKQEGIGGLTWMRVTPEGLSSNIVKYFPVEIRKELTRAMDAGVGDLLLFVAGHKMQARKYAGSLRLKLARDLGLLDGKSHQFLWVVDCPLFIRDPLTGSLEPFHHPFVMPVDGHIEENSDVDELKGLSYDIVLDGCEIGSGSIRVHDPELQKKIFRLLGMTDDEIERKFGFFLEALSYGAPPHGGIALGLDRLVSILVGAETIREVIAFPKNKRFQSPLDDSPAPIEESKLAELELLSLSSEEETKKEAHQ
ncbi:MAG: aspartate--tRNA ligase [Methanomassiliicoccales archaeon]|jgi:aspartyl-tRNA synthetase|nr:aspartate--tRNA ligase [Methanomassiliicoccales archaeon]